jgi:alanyl aminopeptidase
MWYFILKGASMSARIRPFSSLAVALLLCIALVLSAEAQIVRLGTEVMPQFQRIELTLDAGEAEYRGETSIELTVRSDAETFLIHAENLNIESIVLDTGDEQIAASFSIVDSATIQVEPATVLKAGSYTLTISFTNDFDRRANGLFKVEIDSDSYTFTQMEEDEAREAFPCFDEPAFKFPYQFILTVPEDHLALTNTPIESESTKDGWRRVVFARSPPMPSYLLALATGPLETVDVPGMAVPTRVVTTRGQSHLTGEAIRMTPPILAALESYFNSPYPFRKLDLIGVPEFWPGAMENNGAITFAESVLLLESETVSVSQKRRLASVLAHEFAHMWFGDLVTMAWWDDLWLNESFASWLGDKMVHEVYPELGMEVSGAQAMQGVMGSDARPSSQAIRQPIVNIADLMGNIGAIYRKGEAVLGMFENWLGHDEFRNGIRSYISQNEWSNATADDLWRALGESSGWDVGAAMSTFITQPGVPLVEVRTHDDGTLLLSQTRFSNYGGESLPFTPWYIPLKLKYVDGKDIKEQTVVFSEKEMTLDLGTDGPPAWILPHADARGYYRWLVPDNMLQGLADDAPASLTSRERVGYLGNLAALLDAGLLGGDEYLAAIHGFRNDPDPQVVSAVVSALGNVEGAFVSDDLKPMFAPWVRATLGPALSRIGLEARDGEEETVALLRPRLIGWLADEGEDEETMAFARSVFDEYMADPQAVDPGLISVSVGLACLHGDRALYDECQRRFENSEAPAERRRFLGAMGAFRDPMLQQEALKYTLEGPLRPQEGFTIPSGIASASDEHAEMMFQWMMSNYDIIAPRMPPMYKGYLPFFAGGCSRERLETAKVFFMEPEHQTPGIETRLARLSDSVNDCVTLREREGDRVATYLATFADGGSGNASGAMMESAGTK